MIALKTIFSYILNSFLISNIRLVFLIMYYYYSFVDIRNDIEF